MTPHVERLVVRPPNWLGDAVLALPAMSAIRRAFPSARLTIAAAPSVAALFREDTDVEPDRVIELPARHGDVVAALEGEGFQLGILFPNSFRSAWQFWRAGIRERWGYATAGRRMLLTRCSRAPKVSGVLHQSDYYRNLVAGLGIEIGVELPRLAARPPSAERAKALLAQHGIGSERRLAGFAPGAAYGQAKQWPPDRVAEVVARLARDANVTCVAVGAGHDRDAARAIESWLLAHAPEMASRFVNLTGRTSLGALVGLIERMTVFVSNDSGAMHVAAAIGRPVVAVFGPTDERATRPLGDHDIVTHPVFCRPCLLRECPIDHRCMKRVTVDEVTRVAARRLASASA